MRKRGRSDGARQVTAGMLMMAAGGVLLLDQQGVIEVGSIGSWWSLALVALGLWKVTGPDGGRDAAGGAMFMVLGIWILMCTHHWLGLTFRNSWPLVFVVMGVQIIVGALIPRRAVAAAGETEDHHA